MDDIIDINTLFGSLPQLNADMTLETLQNMMERHGIGKACTLSTTGILIDPDTGNTQTRATCASNTSLLPVATLNPKRFYGNLSPVATMQIEDCCLIRFFPGIQEWPIDFAPFRAILSLLKRMQKPHPIMIDISESGQITTLMSLACDYPSPVILASADSTVLSEAFLVMKNCPTWLIETSHLIATGAIAYMVQSLGAERVLFGSGAPVRSVASAIQVLQAAGLDEKSSSLVLRENAIRTLGIS